MKAVVFTDDTSMLVTANTKVSIIEKFNFILIHMSKWFQVCHLILNPVKTKVLKFAPTKLFSPLNLTHAGQFLPEVENMKFLGLQLDSQISWKYRVSFYPINWILLVLEWDNSIMHWTLIPWSIHILLIFNIINL